jgi:hypothetical protein
MAPEQAEGLVHEVGPPADVWALGVVLYRCLSGALPFDADSQTALLRSIRVADPAPLPGRGARLPRDLEAICLRCLEKKPVQRPTVRELARLLDAHASAAPAGSVLSGPAPRPRALPAPGLWGAVEVAALTAEEAPRREDAPAPEAPGKDRTPADVWTCPGCGDRLHVSLRRCPRCSIRRLRVRQSDEKGPPLDEEDERPGWAPVRRDCEPDRGSLVLALGVLSLVCALPLCTPITALIGIALGGVGWWMGHHDIPRMRRGLMDPRGYRKAQAGRACSIIGVALNALFGAVGLLFLSRWL